MVVIVLASCLLGALFDLTKRRLPNWLTATTAVVGFVWAVDSAQIAGAVLSVAAALSVLLVLLPLYLARALGAGDVKMIAALATMWLWPTWVGLLLNIAVAAVALAVVTALWRREFLSRLKNVWGLITTLRVGEGSLVFPVEQGELPFAVAIAIGAALTLRWNPAWLWA